MADKHALAGSSYTLAKWCCTGKDCSANQTIQ